MMPSEVSVITLVLQIRQTEAQERCPRPHRWDETPGLLTTPHQGQSIPPLLPGLQFPHVVNEGTPD